MKVAISHRVDIVVVNLLLDKSASVANVLFARPNLKLFEGAFSSENVKLFW